MDTEGRTEKENGYDLFEGKQPADLIDEDILRMNFDNIDAAIKFYESYAKSIGFSL